MGKGNVAYWGIETKNIIRILKKTLEQKNSFIVFLHNNLKRAKKKWCDVFVASFDLQALKLELVVKAYKKARKK